MKGEIELQNGDCVEIVFSWSHVDPADGAHGITRPYYHFVIDYFTPFCEKTGEPLPPVKGADLEITDDIYEQLENIVDELFIESDINRYGKF